MRIDTNSAAALLSIPITEPERLFAGDAGAIRLAYHQLALHWHPDRNSDPQAAEVTAQINRLHDAAAARLWAGGALGLGFVELPGADGRLRRIRYRRRRAFELGEMLYGDTSLVFLVRGDCADLFENGRNALKGLRYRDGAMQAEMARCLPQVLDCFSTGNGACVMAIGKTPDTFLLLDVLEASEGTIDARHVAWIANRIYNIACYLGWAGITHNAIAPDTVFISPKQHQCMLLGGWWYAQPSGTRLAALPARSHIHAPPAILRDALADPQLDLAMIRVLCRELLGDISGMMLAARGAAPQPMIDFLRGPAASYAPAEYAAWSNRILPDSFGARRFVEMSISAGDIYTLQE
ncbi:MAG TPA: J domain-containing protein [Candidatus Kapabacteria bacterium]|nr:J domain-containing protein [Candidatus Kapabacteria bacterium]